MPARCAHERAHRRRRQRDGRDPAGRGAGRVRQRPRHHRARRGAAPGVQPDPAVGRPRGHPPRRWRSRSAHREWYGEHGVDLRLGKRVLQIDRERRDAMLVDGTCLDYDRLVLATGSIPTLPPIRGLVRMDGQLDARVHAFRSLDDCERLLGAIDSGHPRGRGRRRPPRPPGRAGAEHPRPGHRGRRGRRPPAAQPGRRPGRSDPGPRPDPARAPRSTPAPARSG